MSGVKAESGSAWRGLGHWNLYFLSKLLLLWLGYLNLQPLPNLALAALLLLPLPGRWPHRLRLLLVLPLALALLYQDSWLPPFSRLLAQPGVTDFTWAYLMELAGRFVNWQLCGLLLATAVAYVYLHTWVRFTTFTLAGLAWLTLQSTGMVAPLPMASSGTVIPAGSSAQTLDEKLQYFYRTQQALKTDFPASTSTPAPFDLLLLNICSLGWDDLDAVGLRSHPLFERLDVIFDRFNAATSYSGPAAIRLLRAGCGQGSHASLFESAPQQCMLMDNLRNLGFGTDLALNHNGQFDDFLGEVQRQGGLAQPVVEQQGLSRYLIGFDGAPIRRDGEVLGRWWQHRLQQGGQARALYYNSISLHDGNRRVMADGGTQPASYRERARQLFNDIEQLFDQLEQSGRPVMVVLVPEHGANLRGDRMQIPGMRELPVPAITHVPVGVRLFGMGSYAAGPLHVTQDSSYSALSELVARLHRQQVTEGGKVELSRLIEELPVTSWVAENAGSLVVKEQDATYIRLKENSDWLTYTTR
ncbi:cellulose biosynthesis protein BcsG [uncultured Oceanisphaera sp.]|uniref:cellulose biosynthesis protein BcsG n=1 Tax=uncultured Oceanisphaera sp. TaxID=353858 RepID=UPI0026252B68|nr:cellulose biosynthesis protein BcsG [uncultured Oceanisphaera sp.]